jgi:hypothetical protein
MIAFWSDITDEGRHKFHEWHNREHSPERVKISGFLRTRSYRAERGAGRPAYLTLYEVTGAEVPSGPDYLAKLKAPTPWGTKSVHVFRDTARSRCSTEWSSGAGSGGLISTLRLDCGPHDETGRADLGSSRAKIAE